MSDLIENLIFEAQLDKRKGDYRVYNDFKNRLWYYCSSSAEFEANCIRLAEALKV